MKFSVQFNLKIFCFFFLKIFLYSDLKQNKGSILKASVDYIHQLQAEVQRTKEIEEKLRNFALVNRKLLTRIKV